MPAFLDLDDDILHVIFEKVLNPVNVSGKNRISESALNRAIPLACASTRLMSIFLRSLTDLELWTSATITDAGLSFLCTHAKPYIKRLVLRRCNRLHRSLPLIAHCQAIKSLDLSCVYGVDDDIITRICAGIGSTVQSLLLRRCLRITDEGIFAIADSCVQLRALDIAGLVRITDKAVERVTALRRDTLQILVLSWCHQLTDASLHMLAHTNLQAVFLRSLNISDSGVEAMVGGIGDKIVALDLVDCADVTNSVFTGCLQKCANLRGNLGRADRRSFFQNSVSLMTGYVFVVGGLNEYGQESTVVCVVDAGSANSFAFHVLSGESMTFDADDVKVIATNSGLRMTERTRGFLRRDFGIEL